MSEPAFLSARVAVTTRHVKQKKSERDEVETQRDSRISKFFFFFKPAVLNRGGEMTSKGEISHIQMTRKQGTKRH